MSVSSPDDLVFKYTAVDRTGKQVRDVVRARDARAAARALASEGLTPITVQETRAIVAAVYHHRRDQLRLVGTAALPDGHQLVGLADADGTRSYLLDLDAEAIHVLTEIPTADPRVA